MRLEGLAPLLRNFAECRQRPVGSQIGEHPIHGVDHRLAGPETLGQSRLPDAGQFVAHGVEQLGDAAPPAIDRLLDVADAEEAATGRPVARRQRERLEHLPLRQGRVLELVEQQVSDRGIQPPIGMLHQPVGQARGQQAGDIVEAPSRRASLSRW